MTDPVTIALIAALAGLPATIFGYLINRRATAIKKMLDGGKTAELQITLTSARALVKLDPTAENTALAKAAEVKMRQHLQEMTTAE